MAEESECACADGTEDACKACDGFGMVCMDCGLPIRGEEPDTVTVDRARLVRWLGEMGNTNLNTETQAWDSMPREFAEALEKHHG